MATSLSRLMKKASGASLIPLANRTKTPPRNYTTTIFSTPLKNSTPNVSRQVSRATSIQTHHRFSTLAEKTSNANDAFLSVIESEIDYAEEKSCKDADAPRGFPFKIKDNAGEQSITLTREYQGEEIEVTVDGHYHPNWSKYENEESDHYVCLIGSVSKKSGLTLDFRVTADDVGGFIIETLDAKNPNEEDIAYDYNERPYFSDLDSNMQKAFRAYLEVRGIEPSITKFLYEYITKKRYKKYTAWLKNLKNCIAD